MCNYILTSCSTADMSKEYFESRNIPYVCFTYNMNGVEYPDDLGVTVPFDVFYKKMSEEGAMPVTSQVNAATYADFWEPFLKEGKDILHLGFSGGLSGSYNSSRIASEDLMEKYPERKIITIDTLAASSGFGLLLDTTYEKMQAGATLEELAEWVEEYKLKVHHWVFSTDLTHLMRGGRVSATSAILGTILGICPIINMSNEGKLIPRAKVRTKKKAIEEVVKRMEQHAQDGLNYSGKCFISHSASLQEAQKVASLIETKFPKLNGKVEINSIGTVIGAHTGAGTVALFFWGDKRED